MREVLAVDEPGLLTTMQDLGRPGAMASGVPAGGAVDRFALTAANLLVRNSIQDAALECTASGPALVAVDACVIAITGGDLGPLVDGTPVPMWTAIDLEKGARLTFAGRRGGVRAYVAVAGGLQGARWLGSRSTSLIAGRVLHGRALEVGDVLSVSPERRTATAGRTLLPALRPDYADRTLRAMPGPHLRRLEGESKRALFSAEFSVASETPRANLLLDGPTLAASSAEILPFGLVFGAIQLSDLGRLELLLADHPTAGSRPVVAAVITASMHLAGQLAPGDRIRLAQTTAAQARERSRALSEALATLSAP